MFSIFLRPSSTPRLPFLRSLTSSTSTSSIPHGLKQNQENLIDEDDLQGPDDFSSIRNILRDQPQGDPDATPLIDRLASQVYRRDHKTSKETRFWTPIWNQHFIRPADFTYKARSKRPRSRTPYQLGPSVPESKARDVLNQLNIDPLHEATNSLLLSNFVTNMGKVRPRAETCLTWKNQRRIGQAIRRAKMMGVIPALSKRVLSSGQRRHPFSPQ